MIIDAHAHLSDSDYGHAALYLKQLKEAGIQQGVAVPGGMVDVRKMTDYIVGRSTPENTKPNNACVHQAKELYPEQIQGLICIDPHAPNPASLLEEGFQQGYRGLKLSPITHQFSFASKAVAELAALCGERGYPVYSHVLYNPGASTSRYIALAKRFPKTNFIIGHMGFGPADQEALDAATKLDNVFLETSLGNYLHIQESVKQAGAQKIIFGSEFPLSHPRAELEKIVLLDVTAKEREQILGGNIAGLLQLH